MSRLIRRHRTYSWMVTAVLAAAASLTVALPAHGVRSASAKPPRTVIAVGFQPNSALYRIHPRTGRSKKIGPTGVQLTDVADSAGTLYAIGFGTLYTLDATTGAATLVGTLGVSNANALTKRPRSRTLFGADQGGQLFTINRHNGVAKVIGTFGSDLGSGGDLAFCRNRLYAAVVHQGSTATLLARVNVHTGQATVIGRIGFHDVDGLFAAKGRLYGGTFQGAILSISMRTGRGHRLSKTHLPLGGMTS